MALGGFLGLLIIACALLYNDLVLTKDYFNYSSVRRDLNPLPPDWLATPSVASNATTVPPTGTVTNTTTSNATTANHMTAKKAMNDRNRKLDFFIAGFPKCGTTTLLYAFAKHTETDISTSETCHLGGTNLAEGPAYRALTEVIQDLSPDPNVKLGTKCPRGLRNFRILSLLHRHSPTTKLIVGVRHPIRYFESHYNYRITEIHDKNIVTTIPPIELLTDDNEWRGVSMGNARYDQFMMQLGKTNMTPQDVHGLNLRPFMGVIPNSFPVFLYSLEQMKDTNTTRTANFRRQLGSYLDLKEPLQPLGHENLNHFVGKKAYKETIDICDSKYDDIRRKMVVQGTKTQEWIRDKFLESLDVTVANKDHFLETLQAWSTDPCPPKAQEQ